MVSNGGVCSGNQLVNSAWLLSTAETMAGKLVLNRYLAVLV